MCKLSNELINILQEGGWEGGIGRRQTTSPVPRIPGSLPIYTTATHPFFCWEILSIVS